MVLGLRIAALLAVLAAHGPPSALDYIEKLYGPDRRAGRDAGAGGK